MMNIARRFDVAAAAYPGKPAVWAPGAGHGDGIVYRAQTFAESAERCNRYANGLRVAGLRPGEKVLLMVRPGFDLVPIVFALFKLGAVPVMIDPGMGWRSLLRAVRQVRPQAFIGVPAAHLLRLFSPRSFAGIRLKITLGGLGVPGWALSLDRLAAWEQPARAEPVEPEPVEPGDTAAILFTTGSTGPAKGVVYTHRIFDAQVRILQGVYGLTPDDIDLPCFPLFGLFSTAMGVTAVIPKMDFTRPAAVDPVNIVAAARRFNVTYSFGSPALWEPVGEWCARHGVWLPALRRIFMAGAPVPAHLHKLLKDTVLGENGETHSPYGATEALPVADIRGSELLREATARSAAGGGICVGRPVPGVSVRILPITDKAVPLYPVHREMPTEAIGEIAVAGEVVTREYDGLPEATRLAKMRSATGRVWHRMGDVGYIDRKGRLWFCGRKAHRVRTRQEVLFTIPCESVFRRHPDVKRAALVGLGPAEGETQVPVMIIEPRPGRFPVFRGRREAFIKELLELGAANRLTAGIRHILFRRSFPVDIRHNAKIRREDLAVWAAGRAS